MSLLLGAWVRHAGLLLLPFLSTWGSSAVTDRALGNAHQLGGCCFFPVMLLSPVGGNRQTPWSVPLTLQCAYRSPGNLVQIFWFRRSAFLRSHQMLLLLLIQETHFENTWLRWGPKRPKVPQWLSFLNGAGSVLPFGLLIWLPCGSSFSSYLSTIILLRLFFYIERWWFLQLPEGHLSIVRGISLCYLRKCSVFESPVMRDKKEHNFYPPP